MLSGATDLELAMNEETCRASAQFMKFTQNLRTKNRALCAASELKEEMTGVELKDWQNDACLALDEYDCLFPPDVLFDLNPWF